MCAEPLRTLPVARGVVEPAAQRLARALLPRFAVRRGAVTIPAPARLDRRAAARGEALPFQMTLPGRSRPAPAVVLAVDTSGSMHGEGKLVRARQAAQALALAVRQAGGEVVGLLFSDRGYRSASWDAGPLFLAPDEWPSGGTSFLFLAEVWERFPAHQVVLVTDGFGEAPVALASQRARTVALAIPPEAKPEVLAGFCARVVTLERLSELPTQLALLVPRVTVA